MDVTIEVWSVEDNYHSAECTCGWQCVVATIERLNEYVNSHKTSHHANGDYVEVV